MRHVLTAAVALAATGVMAAQDPAAPSAAVKELAPGVLAGYLPPKALPNSLALLPPPPAEGSAAFLRDEEAAKAAGALKRTPRWDRAVSDADLVFPHASQVFACAAGFSIGEQTTPVLYRLLRRTMTDVGLSTYTAKNRYQRVRPFARHGDGSCTPNDEAALRKDGSYPSGHSAVGWGWALVLTEVAPDRADAVLARGRDFGESRIVCNVHWRSDVDAGRVIASATVARLHADPAFRADLEAAKTEVARARARPDAAACAAEAAAFAGPRG